jgi:hypothetical protein
MDDHMGTHRKVGSLGGGLADRDHLADRLVTQHHRRPLPHVPLQQVAAADPARQHPHQHLPRAGLWQGELLDPQVTRPVGDAGFHAPS